VIAYRLVGHWIIDSGITTVILLVMKTAISIPDPIFESAEKLAKRLGISRSQLYSDAVDALIEKYRYSGVTEQLDAVYETNPEASRLEKDLEALQSQSLNL
jgi:metal-responsive CopG/Arc/MetJ family transcriptional regulator